MHITTDGQQGFVVSGIVGDGDFSRQVLQKTCAGDAVKPDLSVDWVRAFNGGIPRVLKIWMHSIMERTSSMGPNSFLWVIQWFRFSARGCYDVGWCRKSLLGLQIPIKLAAHIHSLRRRRFEYERGPNSPLVNNSITHTWGVTTWDLLGNLDLAQTWNLQLT